MLLQPKHGLFSGAPVKEQWREGIAELAHRVHPDDLVIVQSGGATLVARKDQLDKLKSLVEGLDKAGFGSAL